MRKTNCKFARRSITEACGKGQDRYTYQLQAFNRHSNACSISIHHGRLGPLLHMHMGRSSYMVDLTNIYWRRLVSTVGLISLVEDMPRGKTMTHVSIAKQYTGVLLQLRDPLTHTVLILHSGYESSLKDISNHSPLEWDR